MLSRPRRAFRSFPWVLRLAARRLLRHGQRPDLPWHSSLAADERGPVLTVGHSRGELVRQLATNYDPADASALRGHVATQRPTFLTPNP